VFWSCYLQLVGLIFHCFTVHYYRLVSLHTCSPHMSVVCYCRSWVSVQLYCLALPQNQGLTQTVFVEVYGENVMDEAHRVSGSYEKRWEVWRLRKAWTCWHETHTHTPAVTLHENVNSVGHYFSLWILLVAIVSVGFCEYRWLLMATAVTVGFCTTDCYHS
jgi:hypothetical protein